MQTDAPQAWEQNVRRKLPVPVLILWLSAAIALATWAGTYDLPGWDLRIYGKALASLQSGHDPYSDAIAIQQQHHEWVMSHNMVDGDSPPYSYVYSPITLPLLRAVGRVTLPLLIPVYWALYAVGAIAALFVGVSLGEQKEHRFLLYAAGVAPFFPGLLANGILLSGNIAFMLYGGLLLAALFGWKKGRWWPFYAVVVAASCVKAPFLSFALLPALSARRQIIPAVATIAVGLILFAVQPVLWPSLFRHYLQAVELQFSYNHDFGCAPAGLFSQMLDAHHVSYAPWCYLFYAAYAVPLAGGMIYFSRRFVEGDFPITRWAPVLLVGIILLNPRIMEYDVAPIVLPLAVIAWRFCHARQHAGRWLAGTFALVLILNAFGLQSWALRKYLDGPLLVAILLAGFWGLLRMVREARGASLYEGDAIANHRADRAELATHYAVTSAEPSALRRSA